MNKFSIFFLYTCIFSVICSTTLFSQPANEPSRTIPGLKREINYHPEGGIASIKVTYPGGSVDMYYFDAQGDLQRKQAADGTETTFRFETEDGHRVAFETPAATKTPVKRVFDGRDRVIKSVFPDYSETYEYKYNDVGDIQTVTILKDDDTQRQLTPDDKYLTFLKDYAILNELPIPLQSDRYDREYLYNPTRFREKMQMHKQYHNLNKNQ